MFGAHSRTICVGVLIAAMAGGTAMAEVRLYSLGGAGASGYEPILMQLDPLTGQVLASVTITLPGKVVEHGTAIAAHPSTGELYAALSITGQVGRELVVIDPATGASTSIGDTGGLVTSLDFSPDGTLYGVISEGPNPPPASLYTLSLSDGSPTLITALNGLGGHSMAFDPIASLIYHLGGFAEDRMMEAIDPVSLAITPIPLSGYAYQNMVALTFLNHGTLLAGEGWQDDLVTVTTDGVVTYSVATSTQITGLTFSPPVYLFADGFDSGGTSAWSAASP